MNLDTFEINISIRNPVPHLITEYCYKCLENFVEKNYTDKKIKKIIILEKMKGLDFCRELIVKCKVELEDDFIDGWTYKGQKIKRSEYPKLEKEMAEKPYLFMMT